MDSVNDCEDRSFKSTSVMRVIPTPIELVLCKTG